MKDIDSLNEQEDTIHPQREIKPEKITPEELEEFSKGLSDKLNNGLENMKIRQ